MKRLYVLILALVMTLSLAACGGVDKDAAIETFNETNTEVLALVDLANENLDKFDQPTADSLNEVIEAMAAFKAEIESDDLTQERADEIITELKNYTTKIDEVKTKVDSLIENG